MRDDSSIDAFSDDSDVILDSNQVDVEPIEQHKLTTGWGFTRRMGFRS